MNSVARQILVCRERLRNKNNIRLLPTTKLQDEITDVCPLIEKCQCFTFEKDERDKGE